MGIPARPTTPKQAESWLLVMNLLMHPLEGNALPPESDDCILRMQVHPCWDP